MTSILLMLFTKFLFKKIKIKQTFLMQRTNWRRAFCPSDSLTVVTDSIRSTWWPTFSCPYDWRERPLWAEWQYVKMALRLSELIVSSQKPTISELTIQLKNWVTILNSLRFIKRAISNWPHTEESECQGLQSHYLQCNWTTINFVPDKYFILKR